MTAFIDGLIAWGLLAIMLSYFWEIDPTAPKEPDPFRQDRWRNGESGEIEDDSGYD